MAIKPTKPTTPPKALRSDPATFPARAEGTVDFLFGTNLDYVADSNTFVDGRADAALAAALGGDLPAITGQALKLLRVNAGETAAEFIDPATVVLAEAPELTQLQVEDKTSTVYGQVSGEMLGLAVAANVPALIPADTYERLTRTVTAGTPATIDFTFDETLYDAIVIDCANLVPTNDIGSAALSIRTSDDDGATFDSGASDYQFAGIALGDEDAGISLIKSSGNTSRIEMSGGVRDDTGRGWSGTIKVMGPSVSTARTRVNYHAGFYGPAARYFTISGSGERRVDQIVNGVRLFWSTGTNFRSGGVITAYGIRKA